MRASTYRSLPNNMLWNDGNHFLTRYGTKITICNITKVLSVHSGYTVSRAKRDDGSLAIAGMSFPRAPGATCASGGVQRGSADGGAIAETGSSGGVFQ